MLDNIHWVIVGGETGYIARPMDADWVREIRDVCVKQGVAFFFKQWGEYDAEGNRVGKKQSGRLLDGRTWDELPGVRP
jgi:protein gp37